MAVTAKRKSRTAIPPASVAPTTVPPSPVATASQSPAAPSPASPAAPAATWASLLEPLGVVGLETLEPIFCAALIGEEPLLLIGPHGTGKSYVLERIAVALGLSWRHYNTSLLNYDDLVGYPLPNARGELDFVRTPASIWDAEIVFFDEISRCRPDLQNKLFPILHERRVQGIPLEKLRYRWAAMNPPAAEDALEESLYRGSEPLDAALADRFAFVVAMPEWQDFSEAAQERLIVAAQRTVAPEAGRRLRQVVEEGRRDLPELTASHGGQLARYVRFVVGLLQQARVELSSRRAAMLCRNILAVHAARRALEPEPKLADSAWLALEHSLPQPAYGPQPAATKLLLAHRQAWESAAVPEDDPRSRLWQQRDPLLRALAAGRISSLSSEELSGIIADALAELPAGSRHVLARQLFETGTVGRLAAAVAEQVATLYAELIESPEIRETFGSGSPLHRLWQAVTGELARRDANAPDTRMLENLLLRLFANKQLSDPQSVGEILQSWDEARAKAAGGPL